MNVYIYTSTITAVQLLPYPSSTFLGRPAGPNHSCQEQFELKKDLSFRELKWDQYFYCTLFYFHLDKSSAPATCLFNHCHHCSMLYFYFESQCPLPPFCLSRLASDENRACSIWWPIHPQRHHSHFFFNPFHSSFHTYLIMYLYC